jgi:hypothetical protein
MAELKREDIFPDDLLRAPLQFAENLSEVIKSLDSIKQSAVNVETSLKNNN